MIDSQARMSKFVLKVLDLLVKECKITMLIKVMEISWLMTYVKQIKEEKFKERSSRESKRDQVDNGNFSHQRSGGGNDRAQQGQRFSN